MQITIRVRCQDKVGNTIYKDITAIRNPNIFREYRKPDIFKTQPKEIPQRVFDW